MFYSLIRHGQTHGRGTSGMGRSYFPWPSLTSKWCPKQNHRWMEISKPVKCPWSPFPWKRQRDHAKKQDVDLDPILRIVYRSLTTPKHCCSFCHVFVLYKVRIFLVSENKYPFHFHFKCSTKFWMSFVHLHVIQKSQIFNNEHVNKC